MEQGNPAVTSDGLARYACDHCRQRKLRCSRDLPKCNACEPWPGTCNYSREHAVPNLKPAGSEASSTESISMLTLKAESIDQRLQKVEAAIQGLAVTVNKILEVVVPSKPTAHTPTATTATTKQIYPLSPYKCEKAPELSLGPSHSFSFLGETPAHIEAVVRAGTPLAHQSALSELQHLSASLRTAKVDKEEIVQKFHVPLKAAGYQMIARFLEHAGLGDTFFTTPSDELLRCIIFKPESVTQKAWVVYVNYMMLALISAEEQGEIIEAGRFRRNMRLALNDSAIFLEPRVINVQALTLLAVHGEDFASPNLSWMLIGHACRQAEALGLHAPGNPDFESRQRSLSLFWLLFAVDKSCSLAFGRSSFLPSTTYRDIPLPDFGYLVKSQPHNVSSPNKQHTPSKPSLFRAHLLLARMELAKLMGTILDLLTLGGSSALKEEMGTQLSLWFHRTNRILAETMDAERLSSSPNQVQEMSLGISSMKFQYLHILILLYKGDPSYVSIRLDSAREAISLLPSMVSNWASVNNGMIWHLLYYPFIPFFVLFEHLVHEEASGVSTTQQDLHLLSTTVFYFESLRKQMRVLATICARLQHVATVFLRLVQAHVSHRASNLAKANSQEAAGPVQPTTNGRQANFWTGSAASTNVQQVQADIATDEMDIENLLEWLPADILPVLPATLHEGGNNGTPQSGPSVTLLGSASPQSSHGRKRSFDAIFDWFSWDAFYTETESME
ncbi:hypothetical protein FZEAL_7864 [Fusarium zealandicum]|uniref:Zn(2)-C6 fungal-type domain-containing protein n=1 Tax=Fusarium zealandicum TaxID=1053134 RepID=A0A8H4UEX6_9HYPO|nr:hypothetical protein FZEAL_7864 [Fusarium zealandicum]